MRRLRILLAGALAAGTVAAWSGVVHADGPAAAGGFCDTVEGFQEDIGDFNFDEVDFTDPGAIQDFYGEVADIYGDLGSAAPRKLKKAFKTVQKFAENLSEEEIDFSDPEALDDLVPSARVTKAITKIGNYVLDECGVDLTDTGDVETP